MKSSVTFPDFCDAYLRMFVNRRHHAAIIGNILGGAAVPHGRARYPVPFLNAANNNWQSWGNHAKATRVTLLCDKWCDKFWADLWAQWDNSVYWAKVWAMLTPDLAVPYDSSSRVRIRACTGGPPPQYQVMLDTLRIELILLLSRQRASVDDFRRLDNPNQSGLPFNAASHQLISLPRQTFIYGIGYQPAQRPLSRVIDKCFYTPAAPSLTPRTPHAGPPANDHVRTIATLTQRGNDVELRDTTNGIAFTWGNSHGDLSNNEIHQLLMFFEGGDWKPLGAGLTKPPPNGFGEYLHRLLPRFTPRHASAIAAFIASEYGLEWKRVANALWLSLADED